MERGLIVAVRKDGSRIRLHVRTGSGKRVVRVGDFRPYFYVPDEEGDHVSLFGERLRKVYAPDPSRVPEMRRGYGRHYEADIPYTRRFLIDAGLHGGVEWDGGEEVSWRDLRPCSVEIKPRIWYLDIEVLSGQGFPSPREADQPVTAWTIYDSYDRVYATAVWRDDLEKGARREGNWTLLTFGAEYDLLFALSRLVSRIQPDLLVGWNADEFDLPYLRRRCSKLGIPLDFEGADVFDLKAGYQSLVSRPRYGLKDVAKYEGLEAEVIEYRDLDSVWREDVGRYARYNLSDVRLLVGLDSRHRITEFFWGLKEAAGLARISDLYWKRGDRAAISDSVLVDTLLLRMAKASNVVLPSSGEREHARFEGAYVLKPPAGLLEGVAVFDMSRYYPNIVISFNLSPETKDPNGDVDLGNGLRFRSKPVGIIPRLCLALLARRERLEEELARLRPGSAEHESVRRRRDAVKYAVNAVYGYMGYPRSRLYDRDVAAAVAKIGREGLQVAMEAFSELGYAVVYADTDGVMVRIPFDRALEAVDAVNGRLEEHFRRRYGIGECRIRLKFERYFSRILFVGVKKRYAGRVIWEGGRECDYVVTKGFEAVRTDQSEFTWKIQRELLEMVTNGSSREEIAEYVRRIREEFRRAPLDVIAIHKGINKPLDSYAVKPPHVRGALLANLYLGCNFGQGSRVKMLYVRRVKGLPRTDVICYDDAERLPEVEVDWERMWAVTVRDKIAPILRAVGVSPGSPGGLGRWLS